MIKSIKIHALKSIKDLDVRCSNFTVLVGTNSSGKSTIIQGLLLVAQNSFKGNLEGLNGSLTRLGAFKDAYSNFCSKKDAQIKITICNTNEIDEILINNDELSAEICKLNKNSFAENVAKLKKFYYLSCNRIGVQELYENKISEDKFGIYGQNAFSYLLNNRNNVLDLSLRKVEDNNTLFSHVNYWLEYIVNATLKLEDVPNANKVKVLYSVGTEGIYRSPFNVGSGLSYLASILIMCLASESGSTLVIENPEIHLHPAAQSKLVEFLYYVSQTNRQVFIETHSDHFFNGIRAGIASNKIDSSSVVVNFVSRQDQKETTCTEINFGKNGRVNNPQKDLFDQFDLDLNTMLGL